MVIKLLKPTKTKLINMFNVKKKKKRFTVSFLTLLCGPKTLSLPLRKNKSKQRGFYSTSLALFSYGNLPNCMSF